LLLEKEVLVKSEEIVRQLRDEKQWLEQESKRQVEESERKLENLKAGELQELRRGKVEALQVLQVCAVLASMLLYYWAHSMGPLQSPLSRVVVVVVVDIVVDIDAQAACDSGGSSDTW